MSQKKDHHQTKKNVHVFTTQPEEHGYEPPRIESVSTFDTLLLRCKLTAPMGCTKLQANFST